jgi:predicted metal-dependent phosphoesterase TrpH
VGKIDLHIHTTASDGKFTPAEIVRKSWESGLTHIAICDHDSFEGVIPAQSAAKNYPGLTVISGVEINTDTSLGELHILGYLIDCNDQELTATLHRLRSSRIERASKMIEKLHRLGINIDPERVKEIAGEGSIGRPHIAQAMQEKGYVFSFREAFNKYISRGGPAYVERDKTTPSEAIQMIKRAKGVPALAHPFTCENPESLISELKPAGLMGLEVYYGSYNPLQIQELLRLANKYDLIPTGGSDFHGLDPLTEIPLGTVEVPIESAERLLALASPGVS